LTAIYQQI